MTVHDIFVLPAVDGPDDRLLTEALCSQGTRLADGFQADIAFIEPAAGAGLEAIHRLELCIRRTVVNVGLGIVAERFVREAALLLQAPRSLGRRDIGANAAFLAFVQRRAIVLAGVGGRLQRLGFQRLFCGFGHLVKLARIVAVVDDLARNDQLVLVINRDLNVVARHHLAVLR